MIAAILNSRPVVIGLFGSQISYFTQFIGITLCRYRSDLVTVPLAIQPLLLDEGNGGGVE